MVEFNDRMTIQRQIVQAINERFLGKEEIFSLSSDAIERWLAVNSISKGSEISNLLYEISSKLFFLAAKSQEHVSDEYDLLKLEVSSLQQKIINFRQY